MAYKFPYQSIKNMFEPEMMCDGKRLIFSGFHHDYMGNIQKSGVFEYKNIVKGPAGTYKADIYYKNMKKPTNFFPNDWPHEKVIEIIHESFKKLRFPPHVSECGNFILTGSVQINDEIIVIYTIVDSFNNILISYPNF